MFGFCEKINKNIIKVEKINLKLMGYHINEIRKELGFTQDKLSHKLNISRTLISHYEKGIRIISTADLKGFCELSGSSADYCVGKLDRNIKYKINKKIKPKEIKTMIET